MLKHCLDFTNHEKVDLSLIHKELGEYPYDISFLLFIHKQLSELLLKYSGHMAFEGDGTTTTIMGYPVIAISKGEI